MKCEIMKKSKNCYKLPLPYVIKEQIEPLDTYTKTVLNTGLYNNDTGNIEYYLGFNSVFREPIFSKKNTMTVSHTDPMGTKTMEYVRDNDINRCKRKEPVTSSVWLSDTQNHREDIMSHQVSQMNRNYQVY